MHVVVVAMLLPFLFCLLPASSPAMADELDAAVVASVDWAGALAPLHIGGIGWLVGQWHPYRLVGGLMPYYNSMRFSSNEKTSAHSFAHSLTHALIRTLAWQLAVGGWQLVLTGTLTWICCCSLLLLLLLLPFLRMWHAQASGAS